MANEDKLRVGLKGEKRETIGGELCSFETGTQADTVIELFDPMDYPAEQRTLIEEFNRRARLANERYHLAHHREEMLANGFEAGMYIATFDREENMVSFEFTDGTRRMLGYDGLEDLPNEFDSWVKTLLPEDREVIPPIFWSTVKNHRQLPDISHAEYRMMKKDGGIIWVTGAGKFVRREDDGSLEIYMGCYRDVTADHEKNEYMRIIEGVGKVFNFSLYITVSDCSYKVISTNEFVKNAVMDSNACNYLINIVEATVKEPHRSEMIEWLQQDNILTLLREHDIVTKDFSSDADAEGNWYRGIFMVADRNDDGSISHVIYGCQDITTIKNEELEQQRQLVEARRQAEMASKAKTAFLFNMSHDIRTPMNAILGFARLMEDELEDKPMLKAHLAKVQSSGQYLLSLINNVLDMARIESGNAVIDEQIYQVDDPANSVIPMFEESARKKNIQLTASMKVDHTLVMADKMKLHQIVVNILSNAIKYTPEGGKIDVNFVEQPSGRDGIAKFVISCSDTGIGMTPEFAEHIFDMFSRERNSTASGVLGTGLGMSIVKRLVDLLGGEIKIETALGKGTTFIITMYHRIVNPDEMPMCDVQQTEAGEDFSLDGKRVLLAEDNELNAEIAQVILETMGMEVDLAEDGVVCVNKLCAAEAGRYDVILMDIQMPNMNGYEATQRIRSLDDTVKSHIPIIAMTANAFDEDRRMALEAGMNGHLAKPIEPEKIMRTLVEVLR